jgi:type II secretory pathway pseudopilin PulG
LLELLVVIAIIGILASIVTVSLNSARANSRDATRKAQLTEIAKALSRYHLENGTYHIPGTGSLGGWFGYPYPGNISIGQGLVNAGLINRVPSDPLIGSPETTILGSQRNYMRYCNPGCATTPRVSCLFTDLENPDAADIATVDNSGIAAATITSLKTTYNMSYAVCTRS